MLQVRYHPNFKTKNTLLFAGTGDELRDLLNFFEQWNGQSADLLEYLRSQRPIFTLAVASLQIQRDKKSGLRWKGDKGTWFVSQKHQNVIKGLLDGLLATNSPGHQYLEDSVSPLQIIAAKDEYPLLSPSDDSD